MVLEYTEDFQITWQDEAAAASTWMYDSMHFPRALPPLTADVMRVFTPIALGCESAVINGHLYVRDQATLPPPPEVAERGVKEVWEEDFVPRIATFCAELQGTDFDALDADELLNRSEELMCTVAQHYRLTMEMAEAFFMPTMHLLMFARGELGPDCESLVATLLQAAKNETALAGVGLAELAATASALPEVARCLKEGRFDDIEAAEGGPGFMTGFRHYLAQYGWRAAGFAQIELTTWAEEPEKPLSLIARFVADPGRTTSQAVDRAAEQQRDAVREIESKLAPAKLPEFRSLLAASEIHVPISEGRAHWQLTLMGSLRLPLLALGRRLVAAGAIETPNDVFFLSMAEAREALAASGPSLAGLVAERKALQRSQNEVTPPPFLGMPPDFSALPPEYQDAIQLFMGIAEPDVKQNVVTGKPASKGVATGRARVITDLDEAARLEPGDILVCKTTTQPWTPLFAMAGAVVTDTGGILSHSAICAREYAIPCVVATQVATDVIRDGEIVTVDGDAGTVTVSK